MKIISQFTDYYDFANATFVEKTYDYREIQYNRKFETKTIEYNLPSYSKLGSSLYYLEKDIYSVWFKGMSEKFKFSLEDIKFKTKCLFICGRAYPFIELVAIAPVKASKYNTFKEFIGKVVLAKEFNGITFITKKDNELQQELIKGNSLKFIKYYFSLREFLEDILFSEPNRKWGDTASNKRQKDLENSLKQFFGDKSGDFTELHIKLDTPLICLDFSSTKLNKWGNTLSRNDNDNLYSVEINPLLQQYNFTKLMQAPTLYQEIEMFLGNALVKDIMPGSFQSDLDKLTAKGFDPKFSFRKCKSDNKKKK